MDVWHDSSNPALFGVAPPYFRPLTLTVEAGGGSVQVQRLQSDGVTWAALEGEGVLTESGIYKIDRSNGPRLRIIATGDAKFQVVGQ